MKYNYYHDKIRKIVYSLPDIPTIIEKINRSKIVSWNVSVETEITTASLKRSILETSPVVHFLNDGRYNEEKVFILFKNRHYPKCEEINEEEYIKLKSEYSK